MDEAAAGAHARWSDRAEQGGGRIALEGTDAVTACASDDDVAIMLDNLIENAIHYSPPGTTVSIRWGQTGPEVWLAVEDEGPGIAPGEEETLFDRFARGRAGKTCLERASASRSCRCLRGAGGGGLRSGTGRKAGRESRSGSRRPKATLYQKLNRAWTKP